MYLLLTLLACGTAAPQPEGTLLFVSEDGGAPATWVIGADGANLRPLIGIPGAVFPGAPDPRGTHALLVATEDDEDGHRETLWLASLDGSSPVRLAPPAGRIRNPAWSPDGAWVVVESDGASFRDLYRIDREGKELLRLTDAVHGSFEPAVSPDGARIAFGTSRDGNAEIYVMDADGSDERRVTDHFADDLRPAWSPSGSLAWVRQGEGTSRIWIVDDLDFAAGFTARPLRRGALDVDFAWSPDGKRLAVVVQRDQDLDIEIVDATDGSTLARIARDGALEEHPAWSPDGAWLAFTSSHQGKAQVYLARADGSEIRPLTRASESAWLPRWAP